MRLASPQSLHADQTLGHPARDSHLESGSRHQTATVRCREKLRSARQHSTGGKQRLGSISKMGERTIRRLLIIGGSSMVRQACRHGAPAGSWLERMLSRKPRMLVSVALANKMARMVWALLTKKEEYRAPAVATT